MGLTLRHSVPATTPFFTKSGKYEKKRKKYKTHNLKNNEKRTIENPGGTKQRKKYNKSTINTQKKIKSTKKNDSRGLHTGGGGRRPPPPLCRAARGRPPSGIVLFLYFLCSFVYLLYFYCIFSVVSSRLDFKSFFLHSFFVVFEIMRVVLFSFFSRTFRFS